MTAKKLFQSKEKLKHIHNEIKTVLVVAQIFGLLPVKGITSKTCNGLSFSWVSKRIFITYFVFIGSSFTSLMCIYRISQHEFRLHSFASLVFNANGVISMIAFLKLAEEWPALIKYWTKVEDTFEHYNNRESMGRKFKIMMFIILMAAAVEHLLSVIYLYIDVVDDHKNETAKKITETYFLRSFPHLFEYLPVSIPLAACAVLINVFNVCSWNFVDLFLIILSISISYRFRQVGEKVIAASKMKLDSKIFWLKLREDYQKVCILCKVVNKKISFLILLSYTNNMFFITSQLYWSLLHNTTFSESIYFIFSFGLLLLRTLAVTIFASQIYEDSKMPMSYLLAISPEAYNTEVVRFIDHIHCEVVALTGNNFFIIKRDLLFSMAGSIVTYELFLLQSNSTRQDNFTNV